MGSVMSWLGLWDQFSLAKAQFKDLRLTGAAAKLALQTPGLG
jgi:hypothetical protein